HVAVVKLVRSGSSYNLKYYCAHELCLFKHLKARLMNWLCRLMPDLEKSEAGESTQKVRHEKGK
ncbi:MAG: hypothetical protein WCD50_03320, partial [Onishia taeanensis]|uniref:hypothetical protein n=1 Tax=Onishia taeanensis TaxID=284577 RepID=UPI003C7B76CE